MSRSSPVIVLITCLAFCPLAGIASDITVRPDNQAWLKLRTDFERQRDAGNNAAMIELDALARLYRARHNDDSAANYEQQAAKAAEAGAQHWEQLAILYRRGGNEAAAQTMDKFAAATRRREEF